MSEDTWYYSKSGQQIGPISRAQLEQLVASGQVTPVDFVWTTGMPAWQPASQVFAAYVNQQRTPPPLGPSPFGQSGPFAAAPPAGAAPIGYYSAQYPPAIAYAGFWLRFVAWFIDWIITIVISVLLLGCIGGIIGGILGAQGANPTEIQSRILTISPYLRIPAALVGWLYYAIMESSSRQATFGKSAMGLIVTDVYGQRLSFARASGRFFGKIVSALILGIGFIMIAFTERKQALHDIMAGTLVMKRPG
jgi:uncharacterized RDD family membrane protein YckC